MSTQQQGIIDALATLAATVTGVVSVTKNRPHEEAFGLNQLPAVNIAAVKSEPITEHSAGTDERLTAVVSVFCTGSTSQNDCLDKLAAMLGKIGADETLAGKAIDCRKGERVMVTKHNEAIVSEAHQEVSIDYRTPRWGF